MLILTVLLVLLQIIDVLTTNYALKHGAFEKNGIVVRLMERLGPLWWVPKLALGFAATYFLAASPVLTGVIAAVYFLVILNNLRVIKRVK